MIRTEVEPWDFRQYQFAGSDWTLMPVRRDGRPYLRNWPRLPFAQNKVVESATKLNRNLAVRLAEGQLIINVPASLYKPLNEFTRTRSNGFFEDDYPAVIRPDGSTDYYCRFDPRANRRALWDLKAEFKGLRFYAKGQCVVAAGSVSPEGELYEWRYWPDIVPLSEAPHIYVG
jgi:Bifunctional DNA primase/polymerase, N-terminal